MTHLTYTVINIDALSPAMYYVTCAMDSVLLCKIGTNAISAQIVNDSSSIQIR
jgi:hypothetical protein